MKQLTHLSCFTLLAMILFSSCQKEEIARPQLTDVISSRTVCGQVDYTAPDTVIAGEEFSITALIECGRIALEQGYIEVDGDSVFADLTCETEDLEFTEVVTFECYTDDLSVNLTINTPGTYVFRTKHNGNESCDGNDPPGPGDPGDCDFNGNEFCCFTIEVVEACAIDTGDYWTYSHGFYMQSPNGSTFLNDHPELGPVMVGCDIPGTSTTYTLEEIMAMDPGNSTPPGILVKQIITMTLNVSASAFLGSGEDLGCLIVVADDDPLTTIDDLFAGMTVDEIIAAANAYVGGCDTTTFSSGDLTEILAAIVDNFHEGTDNQGLLTCCEE
jgi:hypothetical protein